MLKNKTAVITGASRGIGKAIALEMAKNGANISVVYASNADFANEICETAKSIGVKAKAYCCNVADFAVSKTICDEIAKDFGGVDILVNNAGITRDTLLLRMSEDDFDKVINVNLKGSFNFTKHLSRYIMRSSAGRIINISSISGLMGNIGQANYSAAKAGMIGLTKTLAREFASKGVTVNAIAPGFIDTDMTKELSENIIQNAITNIPLKRIGKAEEIAALAVFLSSDLAGYITGETIRIDGGLYI